MKRVLILLLLVPFFASAQGFAIRSLNGFGTNLTHYGMLTQNGALNVLGDIGASGNITGGILAGNSLNIVNDGLFGGNVQAASFVGSLNASYLTGTILDGSLSGNVVLRSGTAGVTVTNGIVIVTNTATKTSIVISESGVTYKGLTGSTNAISGSSGMVPLMFDATTSPANPLASKVYAIGSLANSAITQLVLPGVSGTDAQIYVPKTGTINKLFINVRCNGTVGSSENVSCYVTNFTAVTASSTWSMQWTTGSRQSTQTALNLAVTAGDFVALIFVTPAWTTAPTAVTARAWGYDE